MRFKIKVKLEKNIVNLLRDCGYRLHPKDQKSYIRSATNNGFYPRWHLYIKEKDDIYIFNLHLDQKSFQLFSCEQSAFAQVLSEA